MARSLLVLLLLLAACGGTSTPAAQTPSDPTATTEPAQGPSAFAQQYCDGYRACAEERVREAGADGDAAALQTATDAELESCRTTTSGLTPGQEAWLESCTGCGGSCDVYDCMERVPSEADPAPYECDIGGDDAME
jgi:hypothetical protein